MDLIEGGAEFEDAGADGLYRDGEVERGSLVEQQNDTIEFAFAGAPCEGETQGMKEIAATNFERFFQLSDDLFESIRVEGFGIEKEKTELANDVAGSIACQDSVRFG